MADPSVAVYEARKELERARQSLSIAVGRMRGLRWWVIKGHLGDARAALGRVSQCLATIRGLELDGELDDKLGTASGASPERVPCHGGDVVRVGDRVVLIEGGQLAEVSAIGEATSSGWWRLTLRRPGEVPIVLDSYRVKPAPPDVRRSKVKARPRVKLRKGDIVTVWDGKRRGVVKSVNGASVEVALADGKTDPPDGYQALWQADAVTLLERPAAPRRRAK